MAGVIAQVAASPAIGAFFGLAYGTSIRIGYEQIYPALFPANEQGKTTSGNLDTVLVKLNGMYDAIGGKEAHAFGLEQGLNNAMKKFGISGLTTEQKKSFFFSLGEATEEQQSKEMQQKSITLLEQVVALLTFETQKSISGNKNAPSTILDIPLVSNVEFEQGPQNITDKYGYGKLSRGQLLDNQPSQKYPNNANLQDRQTNWTHYYNKLVTQDKAATAAATTAPDPKPLTETQQATNTYESKRSAFITQIQQAQAFVESQTKKYGPGFYVREADKVLAKLVKQLQNLITLARNNPQTKARANNDWNKRIWNLTF